ncbi:hypothetical protein FDP41_011858 [Naegleria fowleri]|uniref:NYN domain-containing protein n=1 Tax=Naegleria fowleri TaxID=5763 RepID=A0A6A5BXK4_NAEFO|nr:uncharacterized protein FDP41_011858 [Naegleria fowleri]KAF0981997.1 hypothetical protein FDP41_011858 [Naegleria fowleri]
MIRLGTNTPPHLQQQQSISEDSPRTAVVGSSSTMHSVKVLLNNKAIKKEKKERRNRKHSMIELAFPFRGNQTLDDFKQCLMIIKDGLPSNNNNNQTSSNHHEPVRNNDNHQSSSDLLELEAKILVRFHNERKAFKIKDEEDWHHVVEKVVSEESPASLIKFVECKVNFKKSNNKHHKKKKHTIEKRGARKHSKNKLLKREEKLKRKKEEEHHEEELLGKRVMNLDLSDEDENHEDDEQQDEEKKKSKIEKDKKRAKREKSAQAKQDDVSLVGEHGEGLTLPEKIRRIFLDGNNMFFMTQTLRDLLLKRKNKGTAEQLIIEIASLFSSMSEILWNRPLSMHVCFDAANPQVMRGDIEKDTFVVSSASKAGFATADDMLVELANRQNIAGHLDSCLFVTSDNGLRQRLKEVGAKVAKSGKWMKCCYAHLCSETTQFSMDEWMNQIVEEGLHLD